MTELSADVRQMLQEIADEFNARDAVKPERPVIPVFHNEDHFDANAFDRLTVDYEGQA